jgi:hypothetical protein
VKKKKRGWLWRLAVSFVGVLAVWFFAFLAWFFWDDLERWVGWGARKVEPDQARKPSQERIFEEERKQLDEILKQRQ